MAAGEKSDQHFADHLLVADDDFLHFCFDTLESLLKLFRLHHTPVSDQRMMSRYSIGRCCLSVGALGKWAGSGALLTGTCGRARLPLPPSLVALFFNFLAATTSSGN